jgi:hypothetical protein
LHYLFLVFLFLSLHGKPGMALPPPDDSVNCMPAVEIVWQKSLGGTKSDIPHDLCPAADGGYVVAGESSSSNGDVFHSRGASDYWIVKLDPQGNIVWKKSYGGTARDEAYSIDACTDGGFIVAGGTRSKNLDVSDNHGGYDFWIIKLKSNGNLEWKKAFGGPADEIAYDVKQTPDGGFVAVGFTKSKTGDVTKQEGLGDYWIVKLDEDGNLVWQKSFGGSLYDFAHAVVLTADGGYVVSGYARSGDGDVNSNSGEEDIWIIKLDSAGNLLWQQRYGDYAGEGTSAMVADEAGNFLSIGISHSDVGLSEDSNGEHDYFLLKCDSEGTLQWSRCYGGSVTDDGNCMLKVSEGGYLIGGDAKSDNKKVCVNHGEDDGWVIKLDDDGNMEWQISVGGSNSDGTQAIIPASDGGFIVANYSKSTNGDVTGNHGNFDYWIVKLAPVSERSQGTTLQNTLQQGRASLTVYPNPTDGKVSVEVSGLKGESVRAQYQLTDREGRIIYSGITELRQGKAQLNLQGIAAGGHYFLRVIAEDRQLTCPFLIQGQ